jgi:hypothetical protein
MSPGVKQQQSGKTEVGSPEHQRRLEVRLEVVEVGDGWKNGR